MAVQLKLDEKRSEESPSYLEFMDSLQTTYELQYMNPNDLNWVGIEDKNRMGGSVYLPPTSKLTIAGDHPTLSVSLYPMVEGKSVTGVNIYQAAMLMRDVRPWSTVGDNLGGYRINGWSGRPEEESMFDQPKTLRHIIETLEGLKDGIKPDTDVVEAVVFLPVAHNGEFETEFNPYIGYDILGDHNNYRITVVAEDKLSAYCRLTDGMHMQVKEIGQDQTTYNWKARYVPDLSAIEQLFLPSSTGHMILIAVPYEKPRPKIDIFRDFGHGRPYEDSFGVGPMRGGGDFLGVQTKSASIGTASIGRGTASGKGSLYQGELSQSKNGNPVIYHLRFLCVKPDQASQLTPEVLDELGKTLSNHESVEQ
ncbi:MAG: hypothetical protein HY831_02300 [Candidatus Aenigmarchaeota archaeon]|nr:hypothetical protein [Candidatus Aenigmarchaeota archaeon]